MQLLWVATVQADTLGLGLAPLPSLGWEADGLTQAHSFTDGTALLACAQVDGGEPRLGHAPRTAWMATCHDEPTPASSWQAHDSAAADRLPVLQAEPQADDPRPELAGGALALAALATVLRLSGRRASA
jgi:hypothetical protein